MFQNDDEANNHIQSIGINDVYLFKKERFRDERGSFWVSYHQKELLEIGVNENFVQHNFSFSKKNVLRGLHFQTMPFGQGKLISVPKGRILDVVVDLRKKSTTYLKTIKLEISDKSNHLLFIPPGCAHGFLAKEDSILSYFCTELYNPNAEQGIRWDDKELAIDWGISTPILSEKDKILPFLNSYLNTNAE